MKVPVLIITGYLGAGKTTLLKRILENPPKKIAVLMNEFGEVGIDTMTIRGSNVDVKELLGGCVCCSLTGEFEAAIKEILEKFSPEMIVVETTGVAEPDAMVSNLGGIEGVYIDSVVCVADADSFVKFPSIGHTGRVQIEMADLIIMNKVDLVSSDQIAETELRLSEINPRARVVRATYSNVDVGMLTGLYETGSHAPRAESDHVIRVDSVVYRPKIFSMQSFVLFVSKLPPSVYRGKGHIMFPDGMRLFNYVGGRYDFSPSSEKESVVVFIGEGVGKIQDMITDDLRSCEM